MGREREDECRDGFALRFLTADCYPIIKLEMTKNLEWDANP